MKRILSICATLLVFAAFAVAQTEPAEKAAPETAAPAVQTPEAPRQLQSPAADPPAPAVPASRQYTVVPGTRVPLLLINSISTRNAREGDQVYLQTAFPIVVSQKIVIPPGSYVRGTITALKRPGRVKGRGELYLRFDSLTLPNGVTRDFRARVGAVDGSGTEQLDRKEGKIQGDSSKGKDVETVAITTETGTAVGAIAGAAGGRPGLGTGMGAAGGALAGLATVLLTRGPDVQLLRGTELDMVLDRGLSFTEQDLNFEGVHNFATDIPQAQNTNNSNRRGGRFPMPFPFPRF